MMKALKPFSHTFFSEWYLSPDRELDGEAAAAKKREESKVGELISFGDEDKGKGKEEEAREFTTEEDTGRGYHGGL